MLFTIFPASWGTAGNLAPSCNAEGKDGGATFECLTATSDAGAQRMKNNLEAIRQRQGLLVLPVTVLATGGEEGQVG